MTHGVAVCIGAAFVAALGSLSSDKAPRAAFVAPKVPDRELTGSVIPGEKRPSNGEEGTKVTPPSETGEPMARVPKSLLYVVLPSLLEKGECEIMPLSLSPYELDANSAAELIRNLNAKATLFREYEAQHSEIITDEDGGQKFRISAFPVEANKMRQEVEAEIDRAFAGFSDDRCAVFKQQLQKSKLFDDFGITAREISIEPGRAPDGSMGYVFSLSRYENGRLKSSSSNPFDLAAMPVRYSKVIEKHRAQIKSE